MIVPLIRRSIAHYWRTHLGVVLGTALAALVLTGALMVGDSVKATLRTQAEARVGKIDEAFLGGERFFPWAREPEKRAQAVARSFFPGADAAGVVLINGSITRADGKARANRVQIVGVDRAFWMLSPISNPIKLGTSAAGNPEIAINERLAAQLGVGAGDDLRIRVEKPSALSRDAPLGSDNDAIVMLRVRVARLVGDDNFGRFSLTSGQVPPHTAFISLAILQEKLGVGEKANVLLKPASAPSVVSEADRKRIQASQAMAKATLGAMQPEKMEIVPSGFLHGADELVRQFGGEISVQELPAPGGLELRSSRIFLDPEIVRAARASEKSDEKAIHIDLPLSAEDAKVASGNSASTGFLIPGPKPPPGLDSLTYFVNELRLGDGSDAKAPATPYSFVTAIDAPASGFVQAELSDDEIQITRWLADDLGAKPGDKVTMRYFVMGERRELEEKARSFTILAPIIEMNEPQLNTSWMPDFPNIPDKDSFSKWKPGFPFDSKRIRKKDEDYWRDYRGTPKAFVNLKIGQEMWGNRWGNLTSIRYPAGTKREQVERIAAFIAPAALGFRTIQVRQDAISATNAPVDFGQLFTAFSFFLILAAAILTGLLFTFSIEQRASEAGLLLAVGWPQRRVKKLFLREGTLLAIIGSVAGVALAALYTKAVLHGLNTVWSGATGGTAFIFAPTALSCGIGLIAGVLVARIAMGLASRKLFKRSAATLLSGEILPETPSPAVASSDVTADEPPKRRRSAPFPAGLVMLIEFAVPLVLAPLAIIFFLASSTLSPAAFFGIGFGLLAIGIFVARRWLIRLGRGTDMASPADLALRNTTRRRGRSLATIAVLCSGVFMVVAVDSFRKGPLDDPTRRESGTGGFMLIGESSAPIYEDWNTPKGRETYALDDKIMSGVRLVQMRVKDGDDASCLNLNRAMQPRVVGVVPADMDGRFAKTEAAPWKLIASGPAKSPGTDPSVPALVDANTLQWALQKKMGDKLEYRDDRGQALNLAVASTVPASILQGMVFISEAAFIAKFPNSAGYRLFLIDCPPEKATEVREHLTAQLGDRGLELIPASQRLTEFNAVENTYLSIFQVLGGLGMLLGSAGLGIVVARNVLERRREFGLLEAVGFTPRQLRGLVFAEHRWLIAGALGIGAVSALVAVWPGISQKGAAFPWLSVGILFGGMAIFSVISAWLATRVSLRASQLGALRSE